MNLNGAQSPQQSSEVPAIEESETGSAGAVALRVGPGVVRAGRASRRGAGV
jgi:hypothetical protein